MGIYLENEDIRNLLKNAAIIKTYGKCGACNGTGWENWDGNGEDVKAGRRGSTDRAEGECEDCKGVGYVF
tara:strand:+ start:296 stop:505 length:210 start_codon:yes stop_codon:yes gene_type:complete